MHVIQAIEMQYNSTIDLKPEWLICISTASHQTHVGWMENNLSLETNSWKYPGEGGLVKISTKLIDLMRRRIVAV